MNILTIDFSVSNINDQNLNNQNDNKLLSIYETLYTYKC